MRFEWVFFIFRLRWLHLEYSIKWPFFQTSFINLKTNVFDWRYAFHANNSSTFKCPTFLVLVPCIKKLKNFRWQIKLKTWACEYVHEVFCVVTFGPIANMQYYQLMRYFIAVSNFYEIVHLIIPFKCYIVFEIRNPELTVLKFTNTSFKRWIKIV